MKYNFTVLIERDEDGGYVASVPALRGCHTQADTVPEVLEHIREAIELCLEEEKDFEETSKFVAVHQMEIAV